MLEPLSRYRGVVLAALTPVALAAPVVAQPEARPEPDLVEIEVVATNRKGEPVAGLAAADFEVEVVR